MPVSTNPDADSTLAVAWTCHVAPFHRSASGTCKPELVTTVPIAVQARGVAHETRENRLDLLMVVPEARAINVVPEARVINTAFGVGWMRHWVPFQCSASVAVPAGV